jgi:DNA-binding PadR family transcriptional regulator
MNRQGGARVEYVVLGLLMLRNLTLYELNKSFQQGISLFYSASYGSLQFAVKKLLSSGYIEVEEKQENGRNKKIYSITDSGRELFLDWMRNGEVPATKLETVALTKLFFLGVMDRIEDKRHILNRILETIRQTEEQLKRLDKQLSQLEMPESGNGIFHYQLKSLDYGLKAHQFAKAWFEEVLKSLEASPPVR